MRVVCLFVLSLTLTGCGAIDTPIGALDSFDGLTDEAAALEDDLSGFGVTDGATLPDSGDPVTYRGVIGFNSRSLIGGTLNETYVGRITMSADFANDELSGSATGFFDSANDRVSGTLTMASGAIDALAGPGLDQVTATMSGTLTDSLGTDLDVAASLGGSFYGPAYEGVAGDVEGSMTGYGPETIDGYFIADR